MRIKGSKLPRRILFDVTDGYGISIPHCKRYSGTYGAGSQSIKS